MPRGRTREGRSRAALMRASTTTRPLLKTTDHGDAIAVQGRHVGAVGDRWVEPFLAANLPLLRRLELAHEVRASPELHVRLTPGPRIGAIPLRNPSTRKVA